MSRNLLLYNLSDLFLSLIYVVRQTIIITCIVVKMLILFFKDSEKYVEQLLCLFRRFSTLVKEAFSDDPRFLTARDKVMCHSHMCRPITQLPVILQITTFCVNY